MRDLEIGRLACALRRRLGWRQEDCARRAGIHRSTWSSLERGALDSMTLRTLRRCLTVVGVDLDLLPKGDRAGFDRLVDEDHAWLEAMWTPRYERAGWLVRAEVSYSHFGERGRVDLVAWHPPTRTLAITEVKTDFPDSQALLGSLDAKVRLGPVVARQLGLPKPERVIPVLIFKESMTIRRRVARLAPLFNRFDVRGASALGWLERPLGGRGVLVFSRVDTTRVRGASSRRVRRRAPSQG